MIAAQVVLTGTSSTRLAARGSAALARFDRSSVPKTCPQPCSAKTRNATSSQFPGTFGRLATTSLSSLSVSRRCSMNAKFAGIFGLRTDSGRAALLDQEELGNHEKGPFCRYLSPLPDSNRGPPPYHFGVMATGGNPRQRFSCV